MSQSRIYTVVCIAVDEDPPFSVDIEKNETVDQLKKLIKLKRSDLFANIDPNTLSLYHVDLAEDDNLVTKVNEKLEGRLTPLSTASGLVDIFGSSTPKGETIHIIVQPPKCGAWTDVLS